MTGTERLELLLPLANGDKLSAADLRRRLFSFLHGFEARGLRLPKGEQELWEAHDAPDAELAATQQKVERVFATGFMFDGFPGRGAEAITPDDIRLPLSFPSLRFGAFVPARGRRPTDGRFTLMIEAGRLRDLVPYLAMHLLVTEAIAVARCPAPAFRNWKDECGRFFTAGGMGRPAKTCSPKCAARVKAKRVGEQQRREREAWKAAQRAKAASQRTTTTRRRRKQ